MNSRRIESRANPLLKLARKIRDGRIKDKIFVEGVRLAEESLRCGVRVELCIYRAGFGASGRETPLLTAVAKSGVDIMELSAQLFSTVADTETSQGIALICERPASDRESFEDAIDSAGAKMPLFIMLSTVSNPSNLGAVIRTAEAAGAAGAIVTKGSADIFSPKALRGSMGSAFRLPIWSGSPASEILSWADRRAYIISAATGDGAVSYLSVDWTKPRLLIFGSEAQGVQDDVLRQANELVKIPIETTVESLNVAVSAGVILFEARRQVLESKKKRK